MCEHHDHGYGPEHHHHDLHALEARVAEFERKLEVFKKRLRTRDLVAETVTVLDDDGRTRVRVEVADGTPDIRLYDAEGQVRARVRLLADGTPQFETAGVEGTARKV